MATLREVAYSWTEKRVFCVCLERILCREGDVTEYDEEADEEEKGGRTKSQYQVIINISFTLIATDTVI